MRMVLSGVCLSILGACGSEEEPEVPIEPLASRASMPHELRIQRPFPPLDAKLMALIEGSDIMLGDESLGRLRADGRRWVLAFDTPPILTSDPPTPFELSLAVRTPCGIVRHPIDANYMPLHPTSAAYQNASARSHIGISGELPALSLAIEWRRMYIERGDSDAVARVGEWEVPAESGELFFPTAADCTEAPVRVGDEVAGQWSAEGALFVNTDASQCYRLLMRAYSTAATRDIAGENTETLLRGPVHSIETDAGATNIDFYLQPFPEAVRSANVARRFSGIERVECP